MTINDPSKNSSMLRYRCKECKETWIGGEAYFQAFESNKHLYTDFTKSGIHEILLTVDENSLEDWRNLTDPGLCPECSKTDDIGNVEVDIK